MELAQKTALPATTATERSIVATCPASTTASSSASASVSAATSSTATAEACHLSETWVDLLIGLLQDLHQLTSLLGI